jgi:ABC-2 type transport system ATP-binding protein
VKAVQTKALCKRYGSIDAVVNLDIEIEEGEIFTLLGPNGAGKSTTVKMLTTLLKPTSGEAQICGKDVVSGAKAVRRLVSLLPQGVALDPFLSVYDNFRFYSKIEKLDRRECSDAIEELITVLDLTSKRNSSVMALSGGQFRRVQVALTLLTNKPVIFLDEPTLGIDVDGKFKVWDLIRDYAQRKGWTVVLSTNDISEAEQLSTRIAFLRAGSIIKVGTQDEFRHAVPGRRIRIAYSGTIPTLLPALGGFAVERSGETALSVFVDGTGECINRVLQEAAEIGKIVEVETSQPTLMEAFRHMHEVSP